MDRLKDAYGNNKKLIVAGAVVGAAALTFYAVALARRGKVTAGGRLTDSFFDQPNLPLYAKEAATREKILSNVSYDLVLALNKTSDTYAGRLKTKFIVNDKATRAEL